MPSASASSPARRATTQATRARARARRWRDRPPRRAALGEAVQGIEALRAEVVEAVEADAIELALALAGKILAGALQARPELVVEVVQGALRRISDRRRITVLVNPATSRWCGRRSASITAQGSGVELCELQSDERVGQSAARSCARAEGEVDASVHTQLERAREVVSASLQQRASEPRDRPAHPARCWRGPPRRSARPTSPGATASSAT